MFGLALLIIFIYPLFYWTQVGTFGEVCLAVILMGILFSLVGGSYWALVAELFPAEVRYTGIGLAFNIAFAVFGSTTPLMVTFFLKTFNTPLLPAFYFLIFLIFAFFGCLSIRQNNLY